MKKIIAIALLTASLSAFCDDSNPADNASERVPDPVIQGKTNDSGKQVGAYDFIVWLIGKFHKENSKN